MGETDVLVVPLTWVVGSFLTILGTGVGIMLAILRFAGRFSAMETKVEFMAQQVASAAMISSAVPVLQKQVSELESQLKLVLREVDRLRSWRHRQGSRMTVLAAKLGVAQLPEEEE